MSAPNQKNEKEKNEKEKNEKVKKLSKKQLAVDNIFKPDTDGISLWVTRDELNGTDLDWGNNGVGRHGVYFGDNRFNWETKKEKNRIIAVRTIGFSTDFLHGATRPIRADIHKYHKAMGCVVCGSHSDLVTDHKNDLYNDPRVLDSKTQTKEDFQCLCNHCNLQKRQVAKITVEKGKRVPATSIPSIAVFGINFTTGSEKLNEKDINAMVGTYWYDPVDFMKKVKQLVLYKQLKRSI